MSNEWLSVVFTALTALAAALAAVVMVGEYLRLPVKKLVPAAVLSLILILAGGAAGLSGLGRPSMIFGVLSNPRSALFWEFALTAAAAVSLAGYLIAQYRGAETATLRTFAAIAGISALGLTFCTGLAQVMAWRAARNTITIALIYLAMTGVMALFVWRIQALAGKTDQTKENSQGYAVVLPVISLFVTAGYLATIYTAPELTGDATLALFTTGAYSALLWVGIILCGQVAPFCCVLIDKINTLIGNSAGLVLTLAGLLAFKTFVEQLGMPTWQFF